MSKRDIIRQKWPQIKALISVKHESGRKLYYDEILRLVGLDDSRNMVKAMSNVVVENDCRRIKPRKHKPKAADASAATAPEAKVEPKIVFYADERLRFEVALDAAKKAFMDSYFG